MLLFFTPLGLIFLWSGSQFKRITKITLTVIFISLFLASQIYYNKKYEKLLAQKPVERIIEMITKSKRKTYLKASKVDLFKDLQLTKIPKRLRVKLAVSDIAASSLLGTVSIKTKDRYGKELGLGSGFVVSKEGFIATNFHVLESAYKIVIKIGDKEFKDCLLVKSDPSLDIALLKIESKDLTALPIGDSDELLNGQFVVVLGNPWGFERSVSSGIISGIRSEGDIKIIQMTAPVSPGSSGGPVINEYGEVVGVTTLASFLMAQNLNFAIPINYLKKIINEQ
ncbi:MAG: trypsin-like peptidase domain-containing protein [Candidatus Omnitrophota bacterium]